MPNCVAVVSGGFDSVTLLHYLVKHEKLRPAVVTFLYGQKHSREIQCAEQNAAMLGCETFQQVNLAPFSTFFATSALVSEKTGIPSIDTVRGDPQPITYVPNRNMIFLSLAAAYAESLSVDTVFYGAQRHDMYGYWDTTPEFLSNLNAVFGLNRKMPIQVKAPFVTFSKAEILRIGLDLEVDYGKTWSCYAGQEQACGTCPTCAERLAAFSEVGIEDPLPYIS